MANIQLQVLTPLPGFISPASTETTCSLVFFPAGNVNMPKAFTSVGQFSVNELTASCAKLTGRRQ